MSGAAALDMTLDDLINSNKISGGGGNYRGRGRASTGPGPARRFPNRGANRAAPYGAFMAMPYAGQAGVRASSMETGTKLYVSNLDYGVSNEDLKELFSEVGGVQLCSMHYDRSGRSKGTAEVIFSRRQDALVAVQRYNNVQLDGKPMIIEIVGMNIVTPSIHPPINGLFGNLNGVLWSGQGRASAAGRTHGHGRGNGGRGFGRVNGRGGGRGEKISAKDLDDDLEKYHTQAMQIN